MQGRQPLRFWYLLSALVCSAIVLIGLRNQLGFYIHPRYHFFTLGMALIGFIVLIKGAFDYKYRGQTDVVYDHIGHLVGLFSTWLLRNGAWFVIIVLGLLLWSPAKPLLSQAAERKERETASYAKFVYDAPWYDEPKTIFQVFTVLNTPDGPKNLEGKGLELTGFIRATKDGNPDVFQISRFVISCCAVDATPSSVPVYYPGWAKDYTVDQWVHVSGSLTTIDQGGKNTQAITDATVNPVSQPDKPYEFISY